MYSLKIDAYSHIAPVKYKEALEKAGFQTPHFDRPPLYDMDERFRILDKYDGILQVITVGLPGAGNVGDKEKSLEIAKTANDAMAELVLKYPDRFVAAIACAPLDDMDSSLQEVDRAIKDLKCRGLEITTPMNDKPLDSPEFMPLYEKMQNYNLPIYIHPSRLVTQADYKNEDRSKYFIYSLWGWIYETTVAMTRLVCSGVLEKYPDYLDTALYGNTPALMCGYNFCGPDHMLFAVDMPLGDSQMGYRNYRQTINAIEQMDIGDEARKKIVEDNIRNLLRLPV